MISSIRRGREMQIHTGDQSSEPPKRRFPVFFLKMFCESTRRLMAFGLRICRCLMQPFLPKPRAAGV